MSKRLSSIATLLSLALSLLLLSSCSATYLRNRAYKVKNKEKSARLLEKAAIKGDGSAQISLGDRYSNGSGVKQSYSNAVKWYRKAAEQGEKWGQYNLGLMYLNGLGVSKDHSEAFKWFRKSAEQGCVDAQYVVGALYEYGSGIKKDLEEAERWWRKAANAGHRKSQYYLGKLLEDSNKSEAKYWYEEAMDNSEYYFWEIPGRACLSLGEIYEKGRLNISIDLDKAKQYYDYVIENCVDSNVKEEAREKQQNLNKYIENNAYKLGSNYYFGNLGYVKDKIKAVKYWTKAANNGNAEAQYNLGICYSQGDGVAMNKQTAFYWYQKAANNGHSSAQYNLGCCYYDGKGCTQDRSKARQWWQKAANQGDPDAQEALRKVKSRTIATGGIIAGGVTLIANAISNNKSSNSSSTSSSNSKNSNSSTSNSENVLSKSGVVITRTEFYEHNVLTAKNDNTVLYIRNDNKYDVFVEIEMRVKGTWKECRITYDYRAATEPLNGSYADDRSSKIHLKANSTRVVEVTSYSSRRPDAIRITRVF